MLRFAPGVAVREALGSFETRSSVGPGGDAGGTFDRAEALAETAAAAGPAPTAASCGNSSPVRGCAATLVARMRAATVTNPNSKPATAAATIIQREPRPRRGVRVLDPRALATTAPSLGGGSESTTAGRVGASGAAGGGLGVGIARSVIFSLALGGGGTLGGDGGGKLERARGMSSDSGALPPRTTTA